MKLTLVCGSVVLIANAVLVPGNGSLGLVALGQESGNVSSIEAQRGLVNEYCIGCHDTVTASGGVLLGFVGPGSSRARRGNGKDGHPEGACRHDVAGWCASA